jgi:NDP-sugar pyrophosphorylase family protein
VVKTTPSSYASFQVVAARLDPEPALITTVDSVLRLEDFVSFARAAGELPRGAFALGLTDHVDDEKPLWADLDPASGRITALGGESGELVTAGMYVLPSGNPPQPAQPAARLRDYLGWLLGQGHAIYGLVLPGVFDVDRASDVVQAERALADRDRSR